MNSRQKVRNIFKLKNSGPVATWLGNPHPDTLDIYTKALGIDNQNQLHDHFNDDCRWICAEWDTYKHPDNKPIWDCHNGREKISLGQPGFFGNCTNLNDLQTFNWPNVKYLDFSDPLKKIQASPDNAVFSGMWSCFFHIMCDLFGMENYFIKMHTDPIIIEAVTDRIVDFYLEANELFFEQAGDSFDTFFMGNDFGSQIDLLISLDMFKKFVMPGFKKLINQAKKYNKIVLLHSCGAIDKAIPLIIDAGVDAIHPLQAKAAQMDAHSLAKKYKDKIAFVGGVDTQDLLVNASPAQVKDHVQKLINILGPNYIVSPSHEALLPNVPLENVQAMLDIPRR